ADHSPEALNRIRTELAIPRAMRLWYVGDAFRAGMSVEDVFQASKIDPWFLEQIAELTAVEQSLCAQKLTQLDAGELRRCKRLGLSGARLAKRCGVKEGSVRRARLKHGIRPVFKRVDTCAAEFPTSTAYLYSSYDEECEAQPSARDKIM